MWGKNKKINELSQSLAQDIDSEDLNYIQSCYTTREDNIMHLRIFLMQTIEQNLTSSVSNIRSVFQTNSNELRAICTSLQALEKHRILHEEALIVKYQNHSKSKSSHGSNSTGLKALVHKIFQKIHKLNIAYLAKIQAIFPKLYEIISSEQIALNNALKESATQLIDSPSLTLGKVFALIAKSGSARLTKEISKFLNNSSFYASIAQERSKNNKNERFYTEKLLQGLNSFNYIIALQKKFFLRQKPIFPTLLMSSKARQIAALPPIETDSKNSTIPHLPSLARYSMNATPTALYDDLLLIDKKKVSDMPNNNNIGTSASTVTTQPSTNNNNVITCNPTVHLKEYESIFEVILTNYEKHFQEWMNWNKYIHFKIKVFSDQAQTRHQLNYRHPLYSKISPAHRIPRMAAAGNNYPTSNASSGVTIRNTRSLQPFASSNSHQYPFLGSISNHEPSSQMNEPSSSFNNNNSNQSINTYTQTPAVQVVTPIISKKFIMPTAPISFASSKPDLISTVKTATFNSTATFSQQQSYDQPRSSQQSQPLDKKADTTNLMTSPLTRLPTFAVEDASHQDFVQNSSRGTTPPDFLNQYQPAYFRKEPVSSHRTSSSSLRQYQQQPMQTPPPLLPPKGKAKAPPMKIPSLESLEIIEDPSELNILSSTPPSPTQDKVSSVPVSIVQSENEFNRIQLQRQQQQLQFSSLHNLDSGQYHFSPTAMQTQQQFQTQSKIVAQLSQFQNLNPQLQMQLQLQNLQQQQEQLYQQSRGQLLQQLQPLQQNRMSHPIRQKRLSQLDDIEMIQKIIYNQNRMPHFIPKDLQDQQWTQQQQQFYLPQRVDMQQTHHPQADHQRFLDSDLQQSRGSFSQPLNSIPQTRFTQQQQQQQQQQYNHPTIPVSLTPGRRLSRSKNQQSQQLPSQASLFVPQRVPQASSMDRHNNPHQKTSDQDDIPHFQSQNRRNSNVQGTEAKRNLLPEMPIKYNQFSNQNRINQDDMARTRDQAAQQYIMNAEIEKKTMIDPSNFTSLKYIQQEAALKKPSSSLANKKPVGFTLPHSSISLHSGANILQPQQLQQPTIHVSMYDSNNASSINAAAERASTPTLTDQNSKILQQQQVRNFVISPPKKYQAFSNQDDQRPSQIQQLPNLRK